MHGRYRSAQSKASVTVGKAKDSGEVRAAMSGERRGSSSASRCAAGTFPSLLHSLFLSPRPEPMYPALSFTISNFLSVSLPPSPPSLSPLSGAGVGLGGGGPHRLGGQRPHLPRVRAPPLPPAFEREREERGESDGRACLKDRRTIAFSTHTGINARARTHARPQTCLPAGRTVCLCTRPLSRIQY